MPRTTPAAPDPEDRRRVAAGEFGSIADCPVCSSNQTFFYAAGCDRLFKLAPGRYTLRRCRSCRCIFQDPIPATAQLARYYPAKYWWAEDTPKTTRAARLRARLERIYRELVLAADHVRFVRRCASHIGSGRVLLDIGCGSGTFLHLASRRGFVPHGMDSSSNAVALARAQYGFCVRQGEIGKDIWPEYRFDFVTMFHVLEHLPDPAAGLAYAVSLLKPGGSLILQVPNADSWQAGIFGSHWHGLDVPRHVINFTPKALNFLLNQTGLRARSICRFSLRDNPAALASSLAPGLDPVGRRGRGMHASALLEGAAALVYFGLFALALPVTWVESALGYGATLWVHAIRREE